MTQNLHRILLPGLVLGSLLWMPACYTQLGTTRDEYHEDAYTSAEDDTTGDNYEQSYADNYVDDSGTMPRYQYGFDYYYPTFGFGFSTYDPWYWRYSGWYYYDPFVCGTYYPTIYAGYPYWPHHGFYFNSPYRYRNYASVGGGRRGYGTTRTFGTTRGGGVVRGGSGREGTISSGGSSGGINLPTGYRSASGTRNTPPASATKAPRVSTGRKSSDAARGGTRTNAGNRVGTTRGGSRGASGSSRPRTYTPPPRSQSGDRGGSGRTYSPPPSSPPPQQSTPPNDAGRSSGSSGGSRGGRGR